MIRKNTRNRVRVYFWRNAQNQYVHVHVHVTVRNFKLATPDSGEIPPPSARKATSCQIRGSTRRVRWRVTSMLPLVPFRRIDPIVPIMILYSAKNTSYRDGGTLTGRNESQAMLIH